MCRGWDESKPGLSPVGRQYDNTCFYFRTMGRLNIKFIPTTTTTCPSLWWRRFLSKYFYLVRKYLHHEDQEGKYLNFLTPRVVMLAMCMISDTSSETKIIPTSHSKTGKYLGKNKNFPSRNFRFCPPSLNRQAMARHPGMDLNGAEPGNFGSVNIWVGRLKICDLFSSLHSLWVISISIMEPQI